MFERTAILLASSTVIGKLSIFMHGEICFTNGMPGSKLFMFFRISVVERNYAITVINFFNEIVNSLDIVAFIGNESTFLNRQETIGLA